MQIINFFFSRKKLVTVQIIFFVLGIGFLFSFCKEDEKSTDDKNKDNTSKAYIIQLSSKVNPTLPLNFEELSRFNFYGICWNGKVEDNLKFAKNMGYSYVMYQNGMENSELASNISFYLETPEYYVFTTLGIGYGVFANENYTDTQKETYQRYCALKNNNLSFPQNIATGWPWNNGFSIQADWQQQHVIDYFVSHVIDYSKEKERPDKNFHFGGLAWDVPQLAGDFWADGHQVGLTHWNGKDSSALFSGTTHEYNTYSEGRTAYYKAIKAALKEEYDGRRLTYIYEPADPYENWFKDLQTLTDIDQKALMEDALIMQEGGKNQWNKGDEFVNDSRIYLSALAKKDHIGSTTPDNHDFESNKFIAGNAAKNGAWFSWYGRFSGSGDNVPMENIYEVPNWLQLIRVVGNWDNLNGVPLDNRSWDGSTYISTNSRIDNNLIYSRQPKSLKLFVVFLNDSGEVTLNPGEEIVSVKRVDSYFGETVDGSKDISVDGNKIRLK